MLKSHTSKGRMHPMNQIIRSTFAGIIVAILASAIPVSGQTQGASVQGTITDASSALIPGVTVTATNPDTQKSSSTISDANGKYAFSGLAEGDYVITAFLKGFSPTEVRKPIAKDSTVQQNFVLEIPPQDRRFVIHPDGTIR
jgi:hypothetical protein